MTTTTYPLYKEFVAFIEARERLRVRRASAAWPWTTDPILGQYRFCNVNRQHDRMTILLQEWLFQPSANPHRAHLDFIEFNAVVCRLFNQAHTVSAIGWLNPLSKGWQEAVRAGVAKVRAKGLTPFNPAYIVSTNGISMDKVEYLLDRVLGDVAARYTTKPAGLATLREWATWYMKSPGLGNFIANQIVTDLKYGPFSQALDWKTFVMAGPGTKRGLNRILGRDKDAGMAQGAAERHLGDIRQLLKGTPLKVVPFAYFDDMNNLSNCFCEFDKYRRAVTLEGKPKQRYDAVEEL